MVSFEEAYEQFLQQQKSVAKGSRLERLEKVGAGEKELLRLIWSLFKSFEGFHLEYEIIGINGVKIYLDVFYEPFGIVFECDGFVVHAELITRDRFAFERTRVRSMAMYGFIYVPFSYDELDKKTDACRRCIYELLGRLNATFAESFADLTLTEKNILSYVLLLNRPFTIKDVELCLMRSHVTCRKYVVMLIGKQLVTPVKTNRHRYHYYELTDLAREGFQRLR
ncbi:hypothetical protein [Paenibacillus daejeonensis]|uniref:hypothetical protein n=1 Tax=Paenibacillus daejeonensis TaxID=135193 RepID=UPI0003731F9C|nr:hypothetical protein [Paenibacillus daejeonensis]